MSTRLGPGMESHEHTGEKLHRAAAMVQTGPSVLSLVLDKVDARYSSNIKKANILLLLFELGCKRMIYHNVSIHRVL